MKILYSKSLTTTELTDSGDKVYGQLVHQLTDGGVAVAKGLKTVPEVLAFQLLGQAGVVDTIRDCLGNSKRNGFILAGGNVSWFGRRSYVSDQDQLPILKILPMGTVQILAGFIANRIGKFNYISSDATSCISSMSALYTANLLLSANELDQVVILSVDNSLAPEYLKIFGENKITKSLAEESDPNCQKVHLGQGVNVTIVSKNGKNALANVKGCSVTAEQHNSPLGMNPAGEGYRTAMRNAMRAADVDKYGINFIKAHSTNTEDNMIEAIVIKELFGNPKVVSYKHLFGHTMGASGLIEIEAAISEHKYGRFLANSSGMGNVFASAVVEIL